MAKGGVVTSLCHPARPCARRAHSVNSVGRPKWIQAALKRSAIGHLLAAGDAGLSDPGEHEAPGEAVLGHTRYVPCQEQRSTREVVLKREDPGALLETLGGDAVYERQAHGDAAHLANPFVVPVSKPPGRQATADVGKAHGDACAVHLLSARDLPCLTSSMRRELLC